MTLDPLREEAAADQGWHDAESLAVLREQLCEPEGRADAHSWAERCRQTLRETSTKETG